MRRRVSLTGHPRASQAIQSKHAPSRQKSGAAQSEVLAHGALTPPSTDLGVWPTAASAPPSNEVHGPVLESSFVHVLDPGSHTTIEHAFSIGAHGVAAAGSHGAPSGASCPTPLPVALVQAALATAIAAAETIRLRWKLSLCMRITSLADGRVERIVRVEGAAGHGSRLCPRLRRVRISGTL
jgi:hypothetical protein